MAQQTQQLTLDERFAQKQFFQIKVEGEDAKNYILALVNQAQNFIFLSTTLHEALYAKKNGATLDIEIAFTNALNRGVERIHVLLNLTKSQYHEKLADKEKYGWFFDLVNAHQGKIKVKLYKGKIGHWVIIDNNHVRLEKEHPLQEPGKRNMIMGNIKYAHRPDKALLLLTTTIFSVFNRWWNDAVDP